MREEGHKRLWNDYFSESPVYDENIFRRRFIMQKHLFIHIVEKLQMNRYIQQHPDAVGRMVLSGLQKCTSVIRMLAYGIAADVVDEYVRIGESTARECLDMFTKCIIEHFGEQYLRKPTVDDLRHLLHIEEQCGFPGMFGSIDCMHWDWKNCPTAWRGQFQGRNGNATIILEVVASQDLWIWHAFFGIPGSCNDLNVLYRSDVFNDILTGNAPKVTFEVNGHTYKRGYYLADDIYPKWAIFVQSHCHPILEKDKLFAEKQESTRKDVERAFGVLQARFAIIRKPSLAWSTEILNNIIKSYIIMHNMIVEDERDTYLNYDDPDEFSQDQSSNRSSVEEPFNFQRGSNVNIQTYLLNRDEIRENIIHERLTKDLTEHIWEYFGPN